MADEFRYSSRNWFGKVSAGVILGYTLAIGLSGILAWYGPDGLPGSGEKIQFNMWITSPLIAGILGACFMFRSGLRAWLWLGAANILCYGLLFGGRLISG